MSARRPRKVLHIAPTPFFSDRGCHIRIQGIVSALAGEKIESRVCTYHHGREVDGVVTRRIGRIHGYRSTRAGPHPYKYWASLKLLWLALGETRRWRPDVIHAHLHEGVLIGWLVKWLLFWRRLPLVADMQGSLVGELDTFGYFGRSRLLARLFWLAEYLIVRMPDRLTVSSAATMTILRERFGVPAARMTQLTDRVRLPPAAPEPAPRPPTVIYTGSLLPGKGLVELHTVLRRLLTTRPALRAIVIGYPTDASEKFIREHGLGGQCRLVGRVPFEELPAYLRQADIGIDPKNADSGEGSGKIVNYMAAGLPVACFDTTNNRELLGAAAPLTPRGDLDALLARLMDLADDPDQCRAEGAANRARAARELSWEAGGRIIRALYEQAAADRAGVWSHFSMFGVL